MICNDKWSYNPYFPADRHDKDGCPYICRLAPAETSVDVQWINQEETLEYTVVCKKRQGSDAVSLTVTDNTVTIDGLIPYCEYEIYVKNNLGKRSDTRLFCAGRSVGTVVNYLHPDDCAYGFSGRHLCSPCIVRLKSGALLASMDIFKGGLAQNLTLIFRSDDNGISWRYVTELLPCFWGKLFVHNDCLYMLAISTEYGDVLIGKSDDEGKTWSSPTVLARGTCVAGRGFHRAPCVLERAGGRLWFSMEYGNWKQGGFANAVISVDENADLCSSKNWIISKFRPREGVINAIEGNMIKAPDGSLINMLRYAPDSAMLLKIDTSNPSEMPRFYKYINFPAAHTKFEILRHKSGKYFALGNSYPNRNILSLFCSDNLEDWSEAEKIIDGSDCAPDCTGFQYPAAIIEDDKILVLSRTAFNGACSFHDNNYCTFHTVDVSKYI